MSVFGIDLGTTYSCIAYIDEYGKPVVLKNSDGDHTTPSVVMVESKDNIIVGNEAKRSIEMEPDKTVQFIKRKMGKEKDSVVLKGINLVCLVLLLFVMRTVHKTVKDMGKPATFYGYEVQSIQDKKNAGKKSSKSKAATEAAAKDSKTSSKTAEAAVGTDSPANDFEAEVYENEFWPEDLKLQPYEEVHVTAEEANIRELPGKDCEILATVQKGEILIPAGAYKADTGTIWYHVITDDQSTEGWVSEKVIDIK